MFLRKKNHCVFEKCTICITEMFHVYIENIHGALKKVDFFGENDENRQRNIKMKKIEVQREKGKTKENLGRNKEN